MANDTDPIALTATYNEVKEVVARVRDELDGMLPPLDDESLNFMLNVQDLVLPLANDIDDLIMDDEEQLSQFDGTKGKTQHFVGDEVYVYDVEGGKVPSARSA